MHEIDLDELLTRALPPDGPYSPSRLKAAASAMRDLTEYLNNATLPGNIAESAGYPGAVHDILVRLYELTERLPQLLEQLRVVAVDHWVDNPALRTTAGGESARTLACNVSSALMLAQESLPSLARTLRAASASSGSLYLAEDV